MLEATKKQWAEATDPGSFVIVLVVLILGALLIGIGIVHAYHQSNLQIRLDHQSQVACIQQHTPPGDCRTIIQGAR